VRSGSISSAAHVSDGAQHCLTCALVVLKKRIRAEDSRDFRCVAVLLD